MPQVAVTQLYRHFDDQGRLLYVGISQDTFKRLYQHNYKAPWMDLLSRIDIERFPSRTEAEIAEYTAIRREKPMYNKMHVSHRELTREGLERARTRGARLGRPKISPEREREVRQALLNQETLSGIHKRLGVGVSAIYRIRDEMKLTGAVV